MMSTDRAVIFDVDGVLVDSYDAHRQSWRAVAREEGVTFTDETFRTTFGCTSRDVIRAAWPDDMLSDEQIARIDDRKEALYREIVAETFPAMEGAVELIDGCRAAGFSIAAGSSGPPENIDLALCQLGRIDSFDAVVTGREVMRGKPDPQVFLLAAERLLVPPRRCVVIEDAAAGIEAAHRAGMRAVGLVSTGRTREEMAGANLIVDSLRELDPTTLERLLDESE